MSISLRLSTMKPILSYHTSRKNPTQKYTSENRFQDRSKNWKKVHSSRTAITSKLWEKRLNYEEEQLRKAELSGDSSKIGTENPEFLLEKEPAESQIEVIIPTGSDLDTQEEYITATGGVRVGKLLEDMDACAGNVAHLHADDNNPKTRPLTIVTASVDRIDLMDKLLIQNDIKMRGRVTFVGSSSMEVCVDLFWKSLESDVWNPLIVSSFTMVSRFDGKPALINKLKLNSPEEEKLFEIGKLMKAQRKAARKYNEPTDDELRLLYDNLFVDRTQDELCVKMKDTELQSVVITQPQERNTNNRVFGGFLMRQSFQLAYATGRRYTKSNAFFLALDQVNFIKPVEIGSIVIFNAKVIYQEGVTFCVEVTSFVDEVKTNTYYYVFTCPDVPLRKIVTSDFEENKTYIEGRRRWLTGKEAATRVGSHLARYYDLDPKLTN